MKYDGKISLRNSLETFLFGTGWGFLLPGFLFYFTALLLDIDIQQTKLLFLTIHLALAAWFLVFILKKRSLFTFADIAFWGLLLLSFLIPGAYLEYPSDPIDHLGRIFRWNALTHLTEHNEYYKYFYFWSWNHLFWVPIVERRFALSILGACTQLLVAFQFYRLMRTLGIEKSWAYLQVAGFFLCFGTSVFGFRYYALSSMPFAYTAYFASLVAVSQALKGNKQQLLSLAFLIPFIALNHYQEFILLSLSSIGLLLAYFFTNQSREAQSRILKLTLCAIAISFPLGAILFNYYPPLFKGAGLNHFTSVGSFRFSDELLRGTITLGIHGYVSVFFALVFFRKYPSIALLTLLPFFCYALPPFAVAIGNLVPAREATYRIFYAMPSAAMLVLGVKEMLLALSNRYKIVIPSGWHFAICASSVIALTAFPASPWYGRLFFHFHIPPAALTMAHLDETAAWIASHRSVKQDCEFIADQPTRVLLSAHLALPRVDRRDRPVLSDKSLASIPSNTCGVLVTERKDEHVKAHSVVANISKHWRADAAFQGSYYYDAYIEASKKLPEQGWTYHRIPPSFSFYEKQQ